jgi:hypothetical protein
LILDTVIFPQPQAQDPRYRFLAVLLAHLQSRCFPFLGVARRLRYLARRLGLSQAEQISVR